MNQLRDVLKLVRNREQLAPELDKLLDDSFELFFQLVSTRGLKFAIAFFKRSRLHFTRRLAGEPLLTKDNVSITRCGLPKWLRRSLDPDRFMNDREVAFILTTLTITRVVTLPPVIDRKPIETEWKGSFPDIERGELFIIRSWLGLSKWDWRWSDYHFSTKSGPNGQALASSLLDLKSLPEQLRSDLELLGGRYIRWAFEELLDSNQRLINLWHQAFPNTRKKLQFRKLSCFPDKEGKSRTIAIFDYWSQTVLKPLHDRLNTVLGGLWGDCTFNQDSFRTYLPSTGPYYSFDLTNATDRMPIALQALVLEGMLGKEKTEAWARVLTQWEFNSPAGPIKYRTGQPMGAYSSWPAMAITHHFLVLLAGLRCGIRRFRDYALLGDDIVIANSAVAVKYKELLCTLDIPISDAKSHTSANMYEFAKRWMRSGIEVTPLSLTGILESWKRYYLFSSWAETQQRNGWMRGSKDPEFILQGVMKIFGKSRQSIGTTWLFTTFSLLQKFRKDPSDGVVDDICSHLALPVPENYNKSSFVLDLLHFTVTKQWGREVSAYIQSKFDMKNHILHKLKELIPDLGELQTVRQAYKEYHPIIGACNVLSNEHTRTVIELSHSKDIRQDIETILMKSLIGSKISLNILSIRSANLRLMSQSRVVKHFINEWKLYLQEEMGSIPIRDPEPHWSEKFMFSSSNEELPSHPPWEAN